MATFEASYGTIDKVSVLHEVSLTERVNERHWSSLERHCTNKNHHQFVLVLASESELFCRNLGLADCITL